MIQEKKFLKPKFDRVGVPDREEGDQSWELAYSLELFFFQSWELQSGWLIWE